MEDINLLPLILSLKIATTATMLSVIFGLPLAWYLSSAKTKLCDVLDAVLALPVVLPPTVLGYYILVLLGRKSLVGSFLEDKLGIMVVFTPLGAIIAACVVSMPFLIKTVRASFGQIDADIINAARILGRSEINILFSIYIPLAWRGVIAGIVLTYARALGDFGVTLMVAGSIPGKTMTMPIAIYDALMVGDTTMVNMLVLVMTAVSFVLLSLLNYLGKKVC